MQFVGSTGSPHAGGRGAGGDDDGESPFGPPQSSREARTWKPDPVLFDPPARRKDATPVKVDTAGADAADAVPVKVSSNVDEASQAVESQRAARSARSRLRATVVRKDSSDIPF
jgi:hypothetical protein